MVGKEIEKPTFRKNATAGFWLVAKLTLAASILTPPAIFLYHARDTQYGHAVSVVQGTLEKERLLEKYPLVLWSQVPESPHKNVDGFFYYHNKVIGTKNVSMVSFAWQAANGKIEREDVPKEKVIPIKIDSNSTPSVLFTIQPGDYVRGGALPSPIKFKNPNDYTHNASEVTIWFSTQEDFDRFARRK